MRTEHIEKIKEIVEEIKVAMLVTAESDDKINSRPMHTQEVDQFGNIWFFTSLGTGKIGDIAENTTVNLAYASPDKNTFLSVTGKARVVRDLKKMEELYNKMLDAWYPKGLDEPGICLLKVSPQYAEYWDGTSSNLVRFFKMAKAIVAGERVADNGVHEKM
jgi:general stress protein 26